MPQPHNPKERGGGGWYDLGIPGPPNHQCTIYSQTTEDFLHKKAVTAVSAVLASCKRVSAEGVGVEGVTGPRNGRRGGPWGGQGVAQGDKTHAT